MDKCGTERMSTEDFLRDVVFQKKKRRRYAPSELPDGISTEEFLRKAVFGVTEEGESSPRFSGTRWGDAATRPKEGRFSVHCDMREGKLRGKTEEGPLGRFQWEYGFDGGGRLDTVSRNGLVVERYAYNKQGQRTHDYRAWNHEARAFHYDGKGRLIQAGDTRFAWEAGGGLAAKTRAGLTTRFRHGNDTRLDTAILPTGQKVTYEYGKGLLPEQVRVDGRPVAEYVWQDTIRLVRYRDLRTGTDYEFHYKDGRAPVRITLRGPLARQLNSACGEQYGAVDSIQLQIFSDQVDSIRMLATLSGNVVSYMEYDSFGNVTANTRPELALPLGFACGLNDPFTGFVRFGFRDYDPEVGRFTSKDPLGDTGGDHDLWEYCVDDPVSMTDPSGLLSRGVRIIGKSIGGRIGGLGLPDLAFPKEASAPEEMYDVQQELQELRRKFIPDRSGRVPITNRECERFEYLLEREKELRRRFGKIYDPNVYK